jgi:hypothetical protein
LEDLEHSFPFVAGKFMGSAPDGDLYEDAGSGTLYRNLVNKHYRELEAELGNTDAPPLYESHPVDFKGEE